MVFPQKEDQKLQIFYFPISGAHSLKYTCLFPPTQPFYSVAYVSRSGGMSNELNNIISHNTDGVFEGVAIGGDRYPGSTYTDHVMRYQEDDRYRNPFCFQF